MICSRTNFRVPTWKEIGDKRIKLVSRQKIEPNGGMIHHLTGKYHPSYSSRFEAMCDSIVLLARRWRLCCTASSRLRTTHHEAGREHRHAGEGKAETGYCWRNADVVDI